MADTANQQEDEAAKRALRRKRHDIEVEQLRCWELKRNLADISAEVELLTQEVARARHACMPQQEVPKEPTAADREQLAQLHKQRLSEIVVKQCMSVLKSVSAHKWAWPFADPVDTVRYPDYLKVVKNPMDLKWVKRKVDAGQYATPANFAADFRQVFANAHTYNPPGSDVYVMASTLLAKFEDKWNQVVVPKLIEAEVASRSDEAAVRERLSESANARSAEALRGEAVRLKGHFESLEAKIAEAKSLAAAACQPMTSTAKRQLLDQMARLSGEQYEQAIAIILARYPGATQNVGEELNLDLSVADALTLRQLQHFCHMCLTPADPPSSWPGLLVGTGIRAFKAPGKRQRMASRQNSDARLMGPPPPVQVADSSTTPIGTPGQLPPIKIYTPSPLGQTYAPAKESTSASALPAALAAAVLQQQRQLAGAGEAAPQAAPEQSITPDGFKVPLPKKLSGNQPSASVQQESVLATEQPESSSMPGAQRDVESSVPTESVTACGPQEVTKAGPTTVAGSDVPQSEPSESGGPVTEAAA
ncbi:probable transcription factor GTE1 [Coccomyxa sp. Obi]|nr:probable transcription factor GTE1 [Coccomyxa sp. Obi]